MNVSQKQDQNKTADGQSRAGEAGANLTDVLAAADAAISVIKAMTDEQLIDALEKVEDVSISRAILGP